MEAEFDKGEDERSEECTQIWEAMQRFNQVVNNKIKAQRQEYEAELDEKPDEDLYQMVLDSFIERNASLAWLRVYNEYSMLYGVETLDGERLYSDIEEIRDLHIEIYKVYLNVVTAMSIGTVDLK